MDALEKFKKHAQTVLLWIEDEKPRVQRFKCENCQYRRYHCDYVLNKGEKAFCKLANKFNISIIEQTEIENQAKDDILYALIKAYQENKNPLKDSEPFLLANLINQYKLDNLIEHICRKYNLNESDFYHDAYHDGSYLKVEYQNKLIA